MGRTSKRKGKRGELEAAKALRANGLDDAHRGRQHKGGPDAPDLLGTGRIHFEVKRVENLSLYPAMEQAAIEAAPGAVPAVLHRRNGLPWLVVVDLDYMTEFCNAWADEINRHSGCCQCDASDDPPTCAECEKPLF